MATFMANPAKDKTSQWYLFDADGKVLGRLATRIAMILMGKHRPEYTPNVDLGDHVVVINAAKIVVKGANKRKEKVYQRFSGYRRGLKEMNLEKMLELKPNEVIKEAVRRMLPKNNLSRKMFGKLHVYEGATHEHAAQKPEKVEA